MNVDIEKLNQYQKDLEQKVKETFDKIDELSAQIDAVNSELANFIDNGYHQEIINEYPQLSTAVTNKKLKILTRYENYSKSEYRVNKNDSDFYKVELKDFHSSEFDIATNYPVFTYDSFVELLKSVRPKIWNRTHTKKVLPRGKFTIFCRMVGTKGYHIEESLLSDGYDFHIGNVNKMFERLIMNDHLRIDVNFGTRAKNHYETEWITLYENPNEYVKELYELHKL